MISSTLARAKELGWHINPEDGPDPAHEQGKCKCVHTIVSLFGIEKRFCPCNCHGLAFRGVRNG